MLPDDQQHAGLLRLLNEQEAASAAGQLFEYRPSDRQSCCRVRLPKTARGPREIVAQGLGVFDSFGIAPPPQTIDCAGGGVDQVWHHRPIGAIGACASLVLASLRPSQNRATTEMPAAGFIPAPGAVAGLPVLAVSEWNASADIVTDAAGRPACLQMPRQRSRKACALVGVWDEPGFSRWWGSLLLPVKVTKELRVLAAVVCAADDRRGRGQAHDAESQ